MTCAQASDAAGRLYAWEAAGHVVGAVLVGLLFGPLLGATGALVCLGVLAVAVGAGVRLFAKDAPRRAIAAAVLVAIPVIIFYVLLQRHFVRGFLTGAVKE